MRGHLLKRSKDSYTIKIALGKDCVTGKYKYKWVSVKGTKKDAERYRSKLLHEVDSGTFIQANRIKMGEYLQRWLREYVEPNLTPRSYERYESIVRVYLAPCLGNIKLSELKPEHIQRHYGSMHNKGLSALTIRYHHIVIHKSLETAIRWGLLGRNVADSVDVPRSRRKDMQTWDEFEVCRFLEAAKDSPYYALFHTALYTGMRRGELLALRWRDVDIQRIYVNRSLHHLRDGSYIFTQPKSEKSRRAIALSPSSVLTLREHKERQEGIRAMIGTPLDPDDLVFSTPEGKPLRPNTVSRAWTSLANRAGLRAIRLHDARHTHATILLKLGVHPKVVQERLGHASIQITLDTYSHVAPGLQEAAADSFDKLLSSSYNVEAEKSPIAC